MLMNIMSVPKNNVAIFVVSRNEFDKQQYCTECKDIKGVQCSEYSTWGKQLCGS